MEETVKIHLQSQIGIEVRAPSSFAKETILPCVWKSKKVYNKNWWYFYPLLLLSIIGYIVAQTCVFALIFVAAHFGEMIPGLMQQGGAILLGLAGGMGMLVMHYEYIWNVFERLPDRSRYTIKYY